MNIAWCAYLDLLGIGDQVRKGESLPEQNAQAAVFLKAMRTGFGWLYEQPNQYMKPVQYRTFSDNVFLFLEFDHQGGDPEEESNLCWLISDCIKSQMELALQGQLIRGGIDVGFIEATNTNLIGSGLVRAYDLEQRAIQPRILVSDRVARAISWHLSYYEHSLAVAHGHDFVWCGDDVLMLNYLIRSCYSTSDGSPEPDMLEKHRKMILDGLDSHKAHPRIAGKYIWLGSYHDWFCAKHRLRKHATGVVGDRFKHMFKELHCVLPAASWADVDSMRKNRTMYDLLGCPLTE